MNGFIAIVLWIRVLLVSCLYVESSEILNLLFKNSLPSLTYMFTILFRSVFLLPWQNHTPCILITMSSGGVMIPSPEEHGLKFVVAAVPLIERL